MPAPSSCSASSEDWTPTRVTPSMSLSAVTKPATDFLARGAAGEFQRRPGDRAPQGAARAAAFRFGFRGGGGVEFGQPDVVGQDQREFAHHPFPVEAAVGEAGDGGHALFVQRLELGVGGEALRFGLRHRVFALQLRDFVLAFGDLVAGDDQQRDPREHGDEGADEDVGDRPGPHRAVGALALLGRDQVDGTHLSSPAPGRRGGSGGRRARRRGRTAPPGAARRSAGRPGLPSQPARPRIALPVPQRTMLDTGTALSRAR